MTQVLAPRSVDAALRTRAASVIPGGMYGHMNAAGLPEAHPQFMTRGEGSRVWDTDGNEYLDVMCGRGSIGEVASESARRRYGAAAGTAR